MWSSSCTWSLALVLRARLTNRLWEYYSLSTIWILFQISKVYPESWVELRFNSTAVPNTKITSQNITANAVADVELIAHTPDGGTHYILTFSLVSCLAVAINFLWQLCAITTSASLLLSSSLSSYFFLRVLNYCFLWMLNYCFLQVIHYCFLWVLNYCFLWVLSYCFLRVLNYCLLRVKLLFSASAKLLFSLSDQLLFSLSIKLLLKVNISMVSKTVLTLYMNMNWIFKVCKNDTTGAHKFLLKRTGII